MMESRQVDLKIQCQDELSQHCPKEFLDWLDSCGFYDAPASAKYHLNVPGGLVMHSCHVYSNLSFLTSYLGIKWGRPGSPMIIGLLHDLCKYDNYIINADGSYSYDERARSLGHGKRSVSLILEHGMELTEEEADCIEFHMGAFVDKSDWAKYTDAIHRTHNVLWAHTADMMAAHIQEVSNE